MVPQISVLTGTASDDALHGPCDVWGLAVDGSISATAIVQLHNNVSSTNTVLVQVQTNAVNGGAASTFERHKSIIFPAPIRFNRALSVTANAGVTRYWVYVSGRAGASIA